MKELLKEMLEEIMFNGVGNERHITITKDFDGEVSVVMFDPEPDGTAKSCCVYFFTAELSNGEVVIINALDESMFDVSFFAPALLALRKVNTHTHYSATYSPSIGIYTGGWATRF